MATTSHIIQVPVETLEIVELPGMGTFRDIHDPDIALNVVVTLKTAASSLTFKRKVGIRSISVYEHDGIADENDPFDILNNPGRRMSTVSFVCSLAGQEFNGHYDYVEQSGSLTGYKYTREEQARDDAADAEAELWIQSNLDRY